MESGCINYWKQLRFNHITMRLLMNELKLPIASLAPVTQPQLAPPLTLRRSSPLHLWLLVMFSSRDGDALCGR